MAKGRKSHGGGEGKGGMAQGGSSGSHMGRVRHELGSRFPARAQHIDYLCDVFGVVCVGMCCVGVLARLRAGFARL